MTVVTVDLKMLFERSSSAATFAQRLGFIFINKELCDSRNFEIFRAFSDISTCVTQYNRASTPVCVVNIFRLRDYTAYLFGRTFSGLRAVFGTKFSVCPANGLSLPVLNTLL